MCILNIHNRIITIAKVRKQPSYQQIHGKEDVEWNTTPHEQNETVAIWRTTPPRTE